MFINVSCHYQQICYSKSNSIRKGLIFIFMRLLKQLFCFWYVALILWVLFNSMGITTQIILFLVGSYVIGFSF